MTTQVVFNVDSKIKAKAMKRAKQKGIPFAAVLKLATKAFADGRFDFDLVDEEVRPEKLKLWEQQSRLVEQGKGRHFASAKEAMEFFENL
ncbi:MAG: hypothetical protein AAB908_02805 [Patescibacteria group bacterium]